MDPNEALRRIRQAADQLPKMVDEVKTDEDAGLALGVAMTLASHFWALDEWLQRGGFLPEAWHYTDRGRRGGITFRLGKPVPAFTEPEPLGGPVPGVNGSHLPDRDDDYTPEGINRTGE